MSLFAKLAKKLTERYSKFETKTETINGIDYFVIVNPHWEENIRVSDEDGIIFFFSTQHAHFDYCGSDDENIDYLVEYIDDFIDGRQVAIEFFEGDNAIFGGSRYLGDINTLSAEEVYKCFVGGDQPLDDVLCKQPKSRCSIRGWDAIHNKDIDFIVENA